MFWLSSCKKLYDDQFGQLYPFDWTNTACNQDPDELEQHFQKSQVLLLFIFML